MKENEINISNLFELANQYNKLEKKISQNEQITPDNKKLLDIQKTIQKQIYSSIRHRDKEERSKVIFQTDWFIREYGKKENLDAQDKNSSETKVILAKIIVDSYFKCLAQEKIASAMQIFEINTNKQLGIAFSNIRKSLKKLSLVEDLFIRNYLTEIKENAIAKSEKTQNQEVLKKCTRIIACEGILQDFIDKEIERTTSHKNEKDNEANL